VWARRDIVADGRGVRAFACQHQATTERRIPAAERFLVPPAVGTGTGPPVALVRIAPGDTERSGGGRFRCASVVAGAGALAFGRRPA